MGERVFEHAVQKHPWRWNTANHGVSGLDSSKRTPPILNDSEGKTDQTAKSKRVNYDGSVAFGYRFKMDFSDAGG